MAYTKAQLDSWRRRENNKITEQENKKKRLNNEITRLNKAYEKIIDLKDCDAQTLKSKTKVKNATKGYAWRGEAKNKFDGIFEEDVYPYSKKLISDDLDRIADEILWEINRKRNEVESSNGIISACKKTVNYIWTLYQTITN